MNSKTVFLMLCIAAATSAGAQVRRPIRIADPSLWVSASAGLFQANNVSDGATASTWDFGQASNVQFRVAAEKAIQNQSSIGLAATYTHAPFTYHGSAGGASCMRCAAHLDLVSLGASFHVGGGLGLHQVLEASAGVAQYRNLRRDSDGADLAPTGGNIDPYFAFGYGFGYGFNPTMQLSVVQDIGIVLHERTGLNSDQSNTLRQRPIRVNFRYGLGSRSRRR
ncbi:MAG: hypothetical protein H0T48_01775 [Gemmatimonadaceae bacterium]|nr:hypothetical protein [Gemmatimonadaceae bacterium]